MPIDAGKLDDIMAGRLAYITLVDNFSYALALPAPALNLLI